MPYDDSNIKKMIRYQTERKVGFSRHKNISDECKNLIHIMLEAIVEHRATISVINAHIWLNPRQSSNQPTATNQLLEAQRPHDSRSRSPRNAPPSPRQRPQSVNQGHNGVGQTTHAAHQPSAPGAHTPTHSAYRSSSPHPPRNHVPGDTNMDAHDDRVRGVNKMD